MTSAADDTWSKEGVVCEYCSEAMTTCGLYTAADGSWKQAEATKGFRLLYTLKQGERWAR